MAQQHWTLEVKVGAFIVSGLALFVVFLFAIGDLSTAFTPGYQLHVVFDSANGITEGSPVQYAGVEVGKVQEMLLFNPAGASNPKVRLTIRLPATVHVRSDDQASISTFGLLGEKYLALEPGPGAGPVLSAGEELIGKPPVSTEQIIERSNEVLSEFKQTLEGLNTLVADPEAHIYLKEAVREARDATRHWRLVGERLNLALSYTESGQGNLGKLLYDERLYQDVDAFVNDLRTHPWKLLSRSSAQQQKPKSE